MKQFRYVAIGENDKVVYIGWFNANDISVDVMNEMAERMNKAIETGLHKTWYIEWSEC